MDPEDIWKKQVQPAAKRPYSPDQYEKLLKALSNLQAALDPDAGPLESFFVSVGEGLVSAQQAIDVQSHIYQQTDPAMPT